MADSKLKTKRSPIPLQKQCMMYLISFLDQFEPSSLSVIPTVLRMELLRNLPVGDLSWLQQTKCVDGLDMEQIWKPITLRHPLAPKIIAEYHCKSLHDFDSGCDFIFTYLYYLILTKTHITSEYFTEPNSYEGLDYNTSIFQIDCNCRYSWNILDSFVNLCKAVLSLRSSLNFDDENSVVRLIVKHRKLGKLCMPLRYSCFIDKMIGKTLKNPLMQLFVTLCRFYPKELKLSCSSLAKSKFWMRNNSIIKDSFSEIQALELYIHHPLERTDISTCQICAQKLLPHVLSHSLTHLKLFFENNFMVGLSLVLITETVQVGQVRLQSLEISIQSRSKTLPADTLTQLQLIPYLLFQSQHFTTLTLNRMTFQDEDTVPLIMANYLSAPCHRDQHLVLKNIHFNFKEMKPSRKFEMPKCAVLHKNLRIIRMLPPLGFLEWLFSVKDLGFQSLEVLLESEGTCDMSSFDIHGYVGFGLKREGFQTVALNNTLQVTNLTFHIHLIVPKLNESFTSLFGNQSIQKLDLSCCAIGRALPQLMQGLEAQRTLGTLKELNISQNLLGTEDSTGTDVEKFYDVVFTLPSLADLSLDMSNNSLNDLHFCALKNAWRRHLEALHSKLKFLGYRGNYFNFFCFFEEVAKSTDLDLRDDESSFFALEDIFAFR